MAKVLYTSNEIRKKVIEIMEDDSFKRTIVVAFVGNKAEHYLNNPKGVKLICWPKPGSTNPYELKRLQDKGVDVFFCNNLHMKIFHCEKKGTVVGSANLSTNAIGSGNLKEAGVFIDSGEFDLKRITDHLNIRKPLKKDWKDLYAGFENQQASKNNKNQIQSSDFLDWLELPIPHKLKLSIHDGWTEFNEDELEYGPENALPGYKSYYKPEDWILTISLKNNKINPQTTEWHYVDKVIPIRNGDYPVSSLQFKPISTYTIPFQLTLQFKNILADECRKYGIEKLNKERHKYLSEIFLNRIARQLRK